MPISITAIRFNDGEHHTHFHGEQGYSLPRGKISVSVDFQIRELDGNYLTITEVLTGQFVNYDALVKAAYRRFARRMAAYGEISKHLETQFAKEDASKV
jgi:hypothetical protein